MLEMDQECSARADSALSYPLSHFSSLCEACFPASVLALAQPLELESRKETAQHFLPDFSPGPINREMRHLISSLQNHNHQLKGDAQRYKRKLREVQAEIGKVSRGSFQGQALGQP